MATDEPYRLATGRKFLQLSKGARDWNGDLSSVIRDSKVFLDIEWGMEPEYVVEQWNVIFAGHPQLGHHYFGKDDPEGRIFAFEFGGNTTAVPYTFTRDDTLVEILTLNKAVRDVIELRLSLASTGNSDWCYLPLFHAEWSAFEKEFSKEYLDGCLLRLPETLPELNALLA